MIKFYLLLIATVLCAITGQDVMPGISGQSFNEDCTCIPYYQCNNGTANTNGENLIDIRIQEGNCKDYLETCCKTSQTTTEKIPPTPSPSKQQGCGYHNPEGVLFKITGNINKESQFGEFPWMVAVLENKPMDDQNNKLLYLCGGALIHPQVVLTAAHCVSNQNKLFAIRAGEWDTQTTNEILEHQDVNVKTVIIHPQYYSGALYHDVALLILNEAVVLDQHIDVVCLPPQDAVIDNTRCFASGWGRDVFGEEGRNQVILKRAELPIVNGKLCKDRLRTTKLGPLFELHRSFICAGGEPGRDTCVGDGGSPLVCPIVGQPNRFAQAGIVSWGIGCGENGIPGVYANVALVRNWINEQMYYNNFNTSSYQY